MYHHNVITMTTVTDPFFISNLDFDVRNIPTTSDKWGITEATNLQPQ